MITDFPRTLKILEISAIQTVNLHVLKHKQKYFVLLFLNNLFQQFLKTNP